MGPFVKILGVGFVSCLAAFAPAQTLPRLVDCGDLNGHATGQPGYELLTETTAPPGVALSPAPLDTVHVAGNFPDFFGTQPLQSDILVIDPDRVDETHLFTSLQLADFTVLTLSGLNRKSPR